jgi:hypothetical protein
VSTFFLDTYQKGAVLSECGKYRYTLSRRWKEGGRTCCFVMLNPSTADALRDDPTIRRCVGFAKAWGCHALEVRNLLCWRATNPVELRLVQDPVGPDADKYLLDARDCHLVVLAWGAVKFPERVERVLELLSGAKLHCLGLTKQGQPRHPLYARSDCVPVPYELKGV